MNYFTSTESNEKFTHVVLCIVRIFVGLAIISHGFPKLQQLMSGDEISFYNFLGLGQKFSLILAVFAEFVCAIFIILGLFTRFAAFFIVFTMAIAGIFVHSGDPFGKRELSFLYLAVYLMLFAFGPGKYSIDYLISDRTSRYNW